MEVTKEEIIYEDGLGRIIGRHTDTKSVILKVEYKDLLPEHITVPDKSLESIVFFLNKARGL